MMISDVNRAEVTPFDPHAATPEQRLAVGQLLADVFAVAVPEDPPLLPEKAATGLTFLDPDEASEQFVVWDGARALGWSRMFYTLTENTHLATVDVRVHPDLRRHGLGTRLWLALRGVAVREGRSVVVGGTSSRTPGNAGEAFARVLGAEAVLTNRTSQLELAALDSALLARWQVRPDGDPYRLHVWETIPDGHLARMADLMMVMNTAPRGELDVEDGTVTPEHIRGWEAMARESGARAIRMVVEDTRSGQLDGYTEVFYEPHRATRLYQGSTAVRPAARGLGLGKWLKAAMLEYARAQFPAVQSVRTSNATLNDAMLGINVALGFQEWASTTDWQLRLE